MEELEEDNEISVRGKKNKKRVSMRIVDLESQFNETKIICVNL